jgi:hypothetical protein
MLDFLPELLQSKLSKPKSLSTQTIPTPQNSGIIAWCRGLKSVWVEGFGLITVREK